jgi:translation initiation factor 1
MRLLEGTAFDRPPRCERCGQLADECRCPPIPSPRRPPEQQTAKIRLERRVKGKTVTVVRGLSEQDNDLDELLGQLKAACGAGGTLKDGELEVQGAHLDRIRELLAKIGYRVHT